MITPEDLAISVGIEMLGEDQLCVRTVAFGRAPRVLLAFDGSLDEEGETAILRVTGTTAGFDDAEELAAVLECVVESLRDEVEE